MSESNPGTWVFSGMDPEREVHLPEGNLMTRMGKLKTNTTALYSIFIHKVG